MSRQYKRAYELTIVDADGFSRIITDLRIGFEISKSVLSFPNLCQLMIYNAAPDTLALLQRKYTSILLKAGYEGNIRLLFKGDVRNAYQTRNGVDSIVYVFAGDGNRSWSNSIYNKTFSAKTSIKTVIEDVIKSFSGTSRGRIEGLPDVADKLLGQTLSGQSKDILDMFASEYNFGWSIQDGELTVVEDQTILDEDQAVLVNSATGMIGSPTVTEIGADVTVLLNPNMLPYKAFKIESISQDIQLGNLFFRNIKRTSAEGVYKILEAQFRGDSRTGDWLTYVKGRLINV